MTIISKVYLLSLYLVCLLRIVDSLSPPYVMLVSPYEPMVSCEVGNEDQSKFSGLDIDMFNEIAEVIPIHIISYMIHKANMSSLGYGLGTKLVLV
jgi:hypothetical protein